jgi:heme-degrading monooxygenase HmoA
VLLNAGAYALSMERTKEARMKPVTVINYLSIKPGKMDEFIETQRGFAMTRPNGLLGGRMYRSLDGKSAVLVSQFESERAQEEVRQTDAFKQHLSRLQTMVESASPSLYEEAYTAGDFK